MIIAIGGALRPSYGDSVPAERRQQRWQQQQRRQQRRQQQQQQEDSISDNNGYLAMSMVSITLVRYRYLKPSSQLIQQSARQRVGRREIDS